MKRIICFSGGHSSAIVAIHCVKKYGRENVVLVNHDLNPKYEVADIKRFKNEVAAYLGLVITYANINNIINDNEIPSQFEVCTIAGALTDKKTQQSLCTNRLKTKPFEDFLSLNFQAFDTLFEVKKECTIYYGFDALEVDRMQRRSSILGAMNYKTSYPIAQEELEITDTNQIGIRPPNTYELFKHANCIGCLKAGLLHWYVVYCIRYDVFCEAKLMESNIDFTIHTITRNKVTAPISLKELEPVFKLVQEAGIAATEHQSAKKFGHILRSFQIEECNLNKPCECIV